MLLEIPYPDIDEVVVAIGPLTIKWYGVLFVTGFLIGAFLLHRLSREGRLRLDQNGVSDLFVAVMLGVIIGGRLGYVLFYKPAEYLADPLEIVRIWKGGLSFHGGLIGSIAALVLFARRRHVPVLNVLDACAVSATPGILLVRCANFINGELWGRPTDVPWAMVFPRAGEQPRHPSQLYEGLLEGGLLFCLLWFSRNHRLLRPTGRLAACFVLGYGTIRFLVEFLREPDEHLGTVLGPLSMGQVLSAGMIALGAVLLGLTKRAAQEDRPRGREDGADAGAGGDPEHATLSDVP